MQISMIAIIALVLLRVSAHAWAGDEALKHVGTIALGDVEGRIDHLAYDPKSHRLFVAALANHTVEVVDVAHGRHVGRIGDLEEPQGVCVSPDLRRVIVASGSDGRCRAYEIDSLKSVAAIDHLEDADNVRYDAPGKRVYVGYGNGALAILDPTTLERIASIDVGGHPESFQLEA